ncbi:MAG: fatty acid desaturase [Candidatus Marinimicrobia bacterium]|jgi:stearoyl-CoA desaturase (delta-9 desaturase)|nr:fatty acid desaturase [Candidatus Neomarinimicrobiota bacterium]
MKKNYNWTMVFFLTILPLVGIVGTILYSYFNGVIWQEPAMLIIGWWLAGMGITFGYHRLFAHCSFKVHPAIQFIAMLCGSAALQNNILKWSSDHRIHHKKLDTEEDPYSITKGFFHAHIGWILQAEPTKITGVHDLEKNPIVMFQHKYYWPIAIGLSFLLPTAIGAWFGRPLGGLLWGGFLRVTLVHHFTFFINSLCHFSGNRPFEPESTARDSWWVAFFTFGEGFHNFHHKFQWDYRNGIRWYDFDPGKWMIKFLSWFGLTTDLRKVEEYTILKARFHGLKDSLQSQYGDLPEKIADLYHEKIQEAQEKSKRINDSWHALEREFSALKLEGFKDRFQKGALKQKRKMLRLEYASILNSLSVLLVSIRSGSYIQG